LGRLPRNQNANVHSRNIDATLLVTLGADVARFPRERRAHVMPRGDKGSYTKKQKRQAEHIEEGYEKRGVSKKEAESRAWATVNKESGGGKQSGSGRGKTGNKKSSKKGGKRGGKKKGGKKKS
jgi:hypothetical protein